jgi:hypothetical protein
VKLTTHLQLVPRSRKRGSVHTVVHTSELVKHRDNFYEVKFEEIIHWHDSYNHNHNSVDFILTD